jgi:hypothetical protein
VANASTLTLPAESGEWSLPSRRKVGVIGLILTESALFTIFVTAYLFYIGKSLTGPYPKDVLDLPILATIYLLSSSLTVVLAERAFRRGHTGGFRLWWLITILLAVAFLGSTALEWRRLIFKDQHQSFRDDLLLAGRLACQSRDRRFDPARVGLDLEPARIRDTGALRARRDALVVLALCRWHMDHRFYRGLHHRPLTNGCEEQLGMLRRGSAQTEN